MMYDLLIFVLFLASLGRLDPYNAAEGEIRQRRCEAKTQASRHFPLSDIEQICTNLLDIS
jgi:hypothetical protein